MNTSYPLGPAIWMSPEHFSCVYTSASTVTLAGLPFTPANEQFLELQALTVQGTTQVYRSNNFKFSLVAATGVLTVAGASFASTDIFRLFILANDKAYNKATNSFNMVEQSPLSLQVVEESLVDTTNITADTNYPSDDGLQMLGYRDFSITGRMIQGAVDMTLSVYGTNDEDATPGSRVWLKLYGYRADANAVVNQIVCNNTTVDFAWDFDNLNYKYVRVNVLHGDDDNTIQIKARRKAV